MSLTCSKVLQFFVNRAANNAIIHPEHLKMLKTGLVMVN